jgi:Omp85 superfamily domain
VRYQRFDEVIRGIRLFGLLTCALSWLPAQVSGQEAAAPSSVETSHASSSLSPPPRILSRKRRLAPREIASKQVGTYVNALPIIDIDPDSGLGFGAVGNVFWDGARTDPFFQYTPYRHRIGAQGFATTNGLQQHFVEYDAPCLGDSPFRLRANILYERNVSANYFGRGSATMGRLGFTGATRSYGSLDEYTDALRQLGPNGLTHTLYNKYDLEDPSLRATLERVFFGGLMRVQAGLELSYVRIRDYSGTRVPADNPAQGLYDIRGTQATTRLQEDCLAKRVVGCAGGLSNTLKFGITLDTRDYEPDPSSGVFVDVAGEFSSRVLGSNYAYARMTLTARGFLSPMPSLADLVLAGRLVYSVQTPGTPFFAMNTLTFTDGNRQGLGGLWTLRGYRQDRFVGPVAALVNLELRWTFVEFDLLDQHIGLGLAPFLDFGRVFDRIAGFSLERWRSGRGASLHIAWNDATIIDITYGVSSEGMQVYMDLGQQF